MTVNQHFFKRVLGWAESYFHNAVILHFIPFVIVKVLIKFYLRQFEFLVFITNNACFHVFNENLNDRMW